MTTNTQRPPPADIRVVLFLDDNPLNVSAALSLGMHARVAQGLSGVAGALTEFGVLAQQPA